MKMHGHHGHPDSNLEQFRNACANPKTALCAGWNNHIFHPQN
jgi:hypothetical protein